MSEELHYYCICNKQMFKNPTTPEENRLLRTLSVHIGLDIILKYENESIPVKVERSFKNGPKLVKMKEIDANRIKEKWPINIVQDVGWSWEITD